MDHWSRIDSVLNSELENFDKFMTGRDIDGEETETFTGRELDRLEDILERPIPERFIQEKLLDEHIKADR